MAVRRVRFIVSVGAAVTMLCLAEIVNAASPPGPPSRLSFLVQGPAVTLQWDPPISGDPPTAYQIEAGSVSGGTDLGRFSTGNAFTSYVAPNVPSGTYYVRVRAVNGSGISAPSNERVIIVTTCAPIGSPTGLGVFSGRSSTVSMAWFRNPAATSYVLQAGSLPGLADLANIDIGNRTSYVQPGVTDGAYFVRVYPRNACGLSATADEVDVIVGNGRPQAMVDIYADSSLPPNGSFLFACRFNGWPGTLTWSTLVNFRELFGTGFTVSSWQINYYDSAGGSLGSAPHTAGEFAIWFAAPGARIEGGAGNSGPYDPGAFPRAPGGPFCFESFRGITRGSATIAVSGTDDRGHSLTFTSTPFVLQ